MSQKDVQPKGDRGRYAFNLTMAAVAGQVGCLTLAVIFIALFGGLWLDNYFQTRPMITIILMIGSVPVTLVAMFFVVRATTARMMPTAEQDQEPAEEVPDRGRTS
jgi:F0F1-type ATP synthase assembly protein I